MKIPDKNEQWLLNGDCSICRRRNYCKKECTKRARATAAWLRRAVKGALDDVTGGAYSTILNRCDY